MNAQVFWMVNAFTHERFKGNPAGVFVVQDFPQDLVMQSIASELNWSQTAFIKILNDQLDQLKCHIRWYSPRDETKICGHATLASAHILFEKFYPHMQRIEFKSLSGPLFASREQHNKLGLSLPLKPIESCVIPVDLQNALVNSRGQSVSIAEVLRDDAIYVVVLDYLDDLLELTPKLDLIEKLDVRAVCVTVRGHDPYDYMSRYFAPKVGIPEDPVCGSSHARLAPYWARKLGGKTQLHTYQASKRSGVFDVQVEYDRVLLIASAITVFEGVMG